MGHLCGYARLGDQHDELLVFESRNGKGYVGPVGRVGSGYGPKACLLDVLSCCRIGPIFAGRCSSDLIDP